MAHWTLRKNIKGMVEEVITIFMMKSSIWLGSNKSKNFLRKFRNFHVKFSVSKLN